MNKKYDIIIFGIEKMAQLAHFYFNIDSKYNVVAFTVDSKYITENTFIGLPVVPFEDIENSYPPERYKMFIAIGYKKLNSLRKEKYYAAKQKGYTLASYFSSKNNWWGDTQYGDNCFIFENQVFQPFVKIGNNVIIWSGNHFGHDVEIGDHSFIASHVVASGYVKIGNSCFIGINASLRDEVTIGDESIIGAGAVINNNVKEKSVYIAESAKLYPLPSDMFEKMMEISQNKKEK